MEKLANLDKSVSSKSVSSSKSTKGSEGTSSAKWDDYTNRVFIQLCVDEIGKGNRPNSHFNTNGWNNLLRRFNEITGRSLVYKQIRNHWDAMKKEWLLFKNLMNSETGIGWNPLKKSIDASEEWWSRKIKDNVEYKKFKNKDLSFIWFEYDQLFCDVAATGERARAPSQRSGYDIENEQLEVDVETNEVQEHDQVGDSDDIGSSRMLEKDVGLDSLETSSMAEKVMFPSLDSIKRKYCGEGGKRKKVSGAASLKEDIHSLLQDCIGAIDGTHVKARLPQGKSIPYIGRKGYATQNILAVVDFNMCFTFVWAGWEGAAHDNRILGEALRNPDLNFPIPKGKKYYLVDAGYTHMPGYMGPYRGENIRYHLDDFRRARTKQLRRPSNIKEKFNYYHSSCRNCIERTFGVWKARWSILADMPNFHIDTQREIVLATMAIHNYIRQKNILDKAFQIAEDESYEPTIEHVRGASDNVLTAEDGVGSKNAYWLSVRDSIAIEIANQS